MLLVLDQRPLCVNCDWLSLSVKIDVYGTVTAPDGMRVESLCGTNIFKERYIMYDKDGSKVLTFCCNPFSSAIPDVIGSVQIANPYLYNANRGWLESLLPHLKGAKFNGLSRWDICCDFVPTDAEYKTIRKLTSGGQYVSGKSAGSMFWHSETYKEREVRMAHCLSWGSPSSSCKVKLYNKSLEIDAAHREKCIKPYILEEWEYHLPDITKVWRLEFSLTDCNQIAFDGRRLLFSDAFDSNVLCRVFADLKRKSFIVRMNQGRRKGHKNEDTIVDFLPFNLEGIKSRPAQAITTREPLTEQRQLARHLLLHMQDKSVMMDTYRYSAIRSLLFDLAENPVVAGYLDSICDGSFSQFVERNDKAIGSGVFDMSDEHFE